MKWWVFQTICHRFPFTKSLADLLTRAKNFLHNCASCEVTFASEHLWIVPTVRQSERWTSHNTSISPFFSFHTANHSREMSLNTDNWRLHSNVQAHGRANSLPPEKRKKKKRKKCLFYTSVTEKRIWPFDNWLFYAILISLAGITQDLSIFHVWN